MTEGDLSVAEVREVVSEFAGSEPTEAQAVREGGAEPFDATRWQRLVQEIGIASLAVSETLGGLDVGDGHLVAVLEQLGRELYAGPARGTMLAGRLVSLAGCGEAVEEILDGAVVALAIDPMADRRDGSVLSEYGANADFLVTLGPSRARLLRMGEGADTEPLTRLDFSRPMARVKLGRAVEICRITGRDATRLTDLARVLRGAEQVGAAYGALGRFVEYAMSRQQFGRIIGSFQALQHSAARVAVDCARAQSLIRLAIVHLGGEHSSAAGLLAAAASARALMLAGDWMVHGFGGIGFTWEHDAHLFYRRALQDVQVAGGVEALERAAAAAGALQLLRQEAQQQ